MPKKFAPEFRRDVVTVARRGDLTPAEVAADFGISVEPVRRWCQQADVDDGIRDGLTTSEGSSSAARSDDSRWRTRSFAAPPRTSLRTNSQNDVPAGPGTGRRGHLGEVDLRGARLLDPGVLQVAGQPGLQPDWDDAHLVNAIVDIHADDPEFGYRFIGDELERAGHQVGKGRVHQLCRQRRIWSTTTKKGRIGMGRPGPAVHDDLVQRDFTAARPDEVRLTDTTEHPTGEVELDVCAIKHVFSSDAVGAVWNAVQGRVAELPTIGTLGTPVVRIPAQ